MASPTPRPKSEMTEEGWPLDELRAAIDEGIRSGEEHGYLDGEEVMAELLAGCDDLPPDDDEV